MKHLKVYIFAAILIFLNIEPIKSKGIILANLRKQTNSPRWKRDGFFSEDPLVSVRKGIQDIQTNVGRSVSSLFAAGSAIGQRMLGIITRTPRLINGHQPSSVQNQIQQHNPELGPQPINPDHPPGANHNPVHHDIDFSNCNCQFDTSNDLTYFEPYTLEQPNQNLNDIQHGFQEIIGEAPLSDSSPIIFPTESIDEYGAPATAPVYIPTPDPVSTTTHTDHEIHKPHITIEHPRGGEHAHIPNILDHNNDVGSQPVIHIGGSKDIDIHKVEVLGAESVVQAPSASVPDQEHPEHYINIDSDLLQDVVEVNLWYKDTKKFKHHKHGIKSTVRPHIHLG